MTGRLLATTALVDAAHAAHAHAPPGGYGEARAARHGARAPRLHYTVRVHPTRRACLLGPADR
jgi:hypothetical protein